MPEKVVRFDEEKFLASMRKCRMDFDAFDQYFGWPKQVLDRIRMDEAFFLATRRFDAAEAAFFARQLEFVKARTYDILYPEYPAMRLFPVSMDAGPGAETITFRQFNVVGQFKLIGNNGKDLPRVDTYGKEFHQAIKSWGASYGYTLQEVRNAMFANVPLEQRKANAARLAYEQLVNKIAFFADGSADYGGTRGLFYAESATHSALPFGNWLQPDGTPGTATPDQIIADVNFIINNPRTLTKNIEVVNQVIMPVAHYSHISSIARSTVSDTTVLQFLRSNHPGVEFEGVNECANVSPKPSTGVAGTSANVICGYNRNIDKLSLEIPQPFEQLPVQETGLEFEVPCHSRIGGILTYYPMSIHIGEGL